MSVLFPLFLAGAGAVLAPILLHLLRNRARTVQVFSTLMFLRPSPPRMQPKTRVENLPLLLLRCLALILLAIAFSRPWWPTSDVSSSGVHGRTLVLLDASASMRRTGLWEQALAHLDQAVADPEQRLAVMAFDRTLRHVVDFEDWAGRPTATRADHARNQVRSIAPGHAGTDLGLALAGAIDLLTDDETAVRDVSGTKRIVLISDLQTGHGLDALRAATWPDGLELTIRQVTSPQPSNAGLSLVGAAPGLAMEVDDARPRLRVSNDSASTAQTFTIAWSDNLGTPTSITVPPGSSRVVRAPERPKDKPGVALVLRGDDHPFDNTVYLSDAAPADVPVVYLGTDPVDDATGLAYFLAHALLPTRVMAPRLVVGGLQAPVADLSRFAWVVVGGTPSPDLAKQLSAHVTAGGAITVVLRQATDAAWLEALCGQSLRADEARLNGHAMIGRVDFTHPLLRPFEAAQFGDFTKIHVWHHRTVTPPADAQVVAWYDDGQPAWFERSVGKGRVLVMTSGWNPADSQLALSTKFVPLIYTELQRSSGIVPKPSQIIIGDQTSMPSGVQSLVGPLDPAPAAVTPTAADDRRPAHAGATSTAVVIEQPGLYRLQTAAATTVIAANLDPLESHTAPVARETLEALGVRVAHAATDVATAAAQAAAERHAARQLQVAEIEQRQKSWLWILAAVLVVLVIETVVASLATTAKTAETTASASAQNGSAQVAAPASGGAS